MKLDDFDRMLLNLLQEDARATAEHLAEHVALSPSAIQRRMRRLREEGIIQRDVAVVDPGHAGKPTAFIVSVQVEREAPDRLARFRTWLRNQPNIQQVFYVTGDTDYILVVTAPDAEAYDDLMSRLVGENPNVKRFTTQVVLNTIKRGLTIPIRLASNSD